jgi:restriction system protein
MWMIRNGGGEYAEEFIDKGYVGIGWAATGSLSGLKTRDQFIDKVKATWPAFKHMKAVVSGSQLHKIAVVIKPKDRVITYDPSTRMYHIGSIESDYIYNADDKNERPHQRKVKWLHKIDRDRLSVPTKNSLGSTLTIFEVPEEAERELDALLSGKEYTREEAETYTSSEAALDEQVLFDDYKSRAKEFTKDKIIALEWDQMQELVAGVLRGMGYKTRISPQGSDRGKDIVASPDGLGLEQPRIVVEVKHRPNTKMSSGDIRSLTAGRHKDDKCLYVSTGGFTKDALFEADRSANPVTLIDIDELVDLVIDNYEEMDTDARTLLPLTKIYWPS